MSASVSNQAPTLEPGRCLGGIYTVETRLGAGAHGSVYKVHHRFLGTQAMKLLHVSQESTTDHVLREAQILSRLSHPHIVRIFDVNVFSLEEGAFPYFTMEYLPLGTLSELLQRRPRLEISESLALTVQILEGLDAAHSLDPPVLHRDLIPSNVLVERVEPVRIKVGDFGVADHAHPITGLSQAAGLITYLPPEAMWGYATTSGDLYATALILYLLATGISAFPIPDFPDTYDGPRIKVAILTPRLQPPRRPSRFRTEISPGLDGLLMKALSPDPAQRFGTANEFSAAVRSLPEFRQTTKISG